jgi:RNA polymerase sigma factor (sigma-70 family)
MYLDFEADIELRYWETMKKGDKHSFAWLYDRYFKLLYNYGKKIGIGNSELEDAIQDLFVDLWRFRANLSSTTSVRFYLYRSLRRRVARNSFANTFFTSDGFDIQDVLGIGAPSSEEKIIDDEIRHQRVHRLKKLLNDLAPRQYEAMVLRFYDELSFAEIASILEVNEQSARNLVQRGLAQLKQYAKHVISALFFLTFLI